MRILIGTTFCNEEHSISQYVDGFLKLDYPKELIDLIWIENNSSDNTWALLQQYHKLILEHYNYHSFKLLQQTADYGPLKKETYGDYRIGKVNVSRTIKNARANHMIEMWNYIIDQMTDEHNFILFILADNVCPPDMINRFIKDMNDFLDCGWVGGIMHRRFPLHRRVLHSDFDDIKPDEILESHRSRQNPLCNGLATPYIKFYNKEELPNKWLDSWIVDADRVGYPYKVRGITEGEILERQKQGKGIFNDVCCVGHIWMIRRCIIKSGFRLRYGIIEAGLSAERDLDKMGYKMYCDSYVYIKHISVDGKIYRHNLSLEYSDEEKMIEEGKV